MTSRTFAASALTPGAEQGFRAEDRLAGIVSDGDLRRIASVAVLDTSHQPGSVLHLHDLWQTELS